jgi:hypothetical protein
MKPNRRPFPIRGLLMLAWIILSSILAVRLSGPPAARPESISWSEFSGERAYRHLPFVAGEPHPVGSPANAQVRDYIVEELEMHGYVVEIQRATAAYRSSISRVENILAQLEGENPAAGSAVLLVAHYDSVYGSPGANDNGAAVAALLEAARALKAGPPLKNNVIFLFTDGEEAGLLGASAFVREHPWAEEAGVVLNFEARGRTGPVYTFETSADNAWLAQALAEAVRFPTANSLMYELYRLLPNDTDFTVFRQAGLPGLNFAYVGGLTHYHSVLDTPESVDPDTLEQQGGYALGLARYFGGADRAPSAGEAVFFDLFSRLLVHYPAGWALPLAAAAGLLALIYAAIARRLGRVPRAWLAAGPLIAGLVPVVAAGLAWLIWEVLALLYPHFAQAPDLYNSGLYWAAFLLLGAAAAVFFANWLEKIYVRESLVSAPLLLWAALGLLSAVYLPGASFLFIWPLSGALASAAALSFLLREKAQWALLALGALPGVALIPVTLYGAHLGLSVAVLPVQAAAGALWVGLLAPQLAGMEPLLRRWLPGMLLIAAGVLLAAGSMTARFTEEHPRPSFLMYTLSKDSGESLWATTDPSTDWVTQFTGEEDGEGVLLPDIFPSGSMRYTTAPAPALDLPAPQVEVLGYTKDGEVHTLRLRVYSPRQAGRGSLFLPTAERLLAVRAEGVEMEQIQSKPDLYLDALFEQGYELEIELVAPEGPVALLFVDHSRGLPPEAVVGYAERPAELIPDPRYYADGVLVSKWYFIGK